MSDIVGTEPTKFISTPPDYLDCVEKLTWPFYIRWTSGPDYERAYLCVEDDGADMVDFATVSFGMANTFKAGILAQQAVADAERPFPNWTTRTWQGAIPKLFGISKAIRTEGGDGWKDTGRKGDAYFVYGREMRAPYGAGQFMHVGNPISSSSVDNNRFERPSIKEWLALLPSIIHDLRFERRQLSLMFDKKD